MSTPRIADSAEGSNEDSAEGSSDESMSVDVLTENLARLPLSPRSNVTAPCTIPPTDQATVYRLVEKYGAVRMMSFNAPPKLFFSWNPLVTEC